MEEPNITKEYFSEIEKVGTGLENSCLEQEILTAFEPVLQSLMQHFSATAIEMFVFCTVYALTSSSGKYITLQEICEYYFPRKNPLSIQKENHWKMTLCNTLDFLEKQSLVEREENGIGYAVSSKAWDCLLQQVVFDPSFHNEIPSKSYRTFIRDFENAYNKRPSFNELQFIVENLELSTHPNPERIITLLNIDDRILLYAFCLGMVNYDPESVEDVLENVYKDEPQLLELKKWDFMGLTGHLLNRGLIELNDDSFVDENGEFAICGIVTLRGLELVFGEFGKNVYNAFHTYLNNDFFEGCDPFDTNNSFFLDSSPFAPPPPLPSSTGFGIAETPAPGEKLSTIIEPNSIKKVGLFFPPVQEEEMKRMTSRLNQRNFREIRKDFSYHNLKPGFTVLFYGESGTGKTESVLQIARMTNRPLFKIELSQLRTSKVGDNEQRVKKIFDEYKIFYMKCIRRGTNLPILFLNEIDGFFSKRNPVEGHNSSIQQSENTMIEIFFEELDRFEGLLFATSNHPEYLDDALQRRFFIKMKFEKPTANIRAKIWETTLRMNHIPKEEIERLSSDYEFSGASLENIMKKALFLWDNKPTVEELQHCCEEELLSDDADLIEVEKAFEEIKPSKIEEKDLYFEPSTEKDLAEISLCLDKDKFIEMQNRMKEENLCKGFSALLYGKPGTGKTETVLQIAKKVGRKIKKIDISQIRSKYVSEAEKKLKKIFVSYKRECKRCRDGNEPIPILLLNEADGLLTKRVEVSDDSSSNAQRENTLMSIFLDEMETFDGILFATTNLTENLDKALERRFLYKIEFSKPNSEIRAKIWKNKMSSLSEQQVEELVSRFDFSGGEIDNIVRKSVKHYVVKGEKPSFEDIEKFCEEERINGKEIGFAA